MPSPPPRVDRLARIARLRVGRARRWRRAVSSADRRLLARAARRRGPVSNRVMVLLSTAADHSALWVGVAGLLWSTGRRRARTAAGAGLLGIGIAATLANGPLKFLWRRDRPQALLPPLLPLPRTFSFPSGHAASAAAFATGVAVALPEAGAAVASVAAAVAYSRVHTGVHYPSDVAVGAAVGVGSGAVAAAIVRGLRQRSVHRADAAPTGGPVPRQAVLLENRHSGSAAGLDLARQALADLGVDIVETVAVSSAERLDELVGSADPPGLVVAAGGDGTVGCAANAVVGSGAVLGVIPLGTSNDVARSLGIPPDPQEAAQALADGWVGLVDVGLMTIGGRRLVFCNAATAGLNVAFAKVADDHGLRDRFGGLSYPVAAARAVRAYEPFTCTISRDGRPTTLELVHLSVSNAPVFGGLLGMRVPGASMTDGLLDVIAVERLSLTRLAYAVGETFVGRHEPVRRVHAFRTERLDVSARTAQQVALDGEVVGELPISFEVLPAALPVVLPRA